MVSLTDNKQKFFRDIKNALYSDEYIIQKYLCNGSSPILDDDELFSIKHKISTHFNVHPNEVVLTGSGKLGFSLAPDKKYMIFNDNSDIDIAIISNKLFEQYWYEILQNFNTYNINKNFIIYLFKGWIRPDLFPYSYKGKQEWFQFFNELTHEIYEYGEHKISAGIYKDFTTFEIYNKKNIKRIRSEVMAGVRYE